MRTRDAAAFHRLLNRVVLEDGLELEAVAPADDDVNAVYQYLIGSDAEARVSSIALRPRAGRPLVRRQRRQWCGSSSRKRFSLWRSLWLLLPGLRPGAHHRRPTRSRTARCHLEEETLILAGIVQFYYVRFGDLLRLPGHLRCACIRGEMAERTLHYAFLAPVRRERADRRQVPGGRAASALDLRRRRPGAASP